MPTARTADLGSRPRPGPRTRYPPQNPGGPDGPMTVLLPALGLLAVVALTLGTAIAVASEFSLTALERSRVDRHAATVGDRRARAVARAHRNLSFQLSGCQLAITITTLVTGYIAEPAVASLIRPGLAAVGVPDRFTGGLATTLALLLATALSMIFGELVPKNVAIADPLRTARAVVWLQAGFARSLQQAHRRPQRRRQRHRPQPRRRADRGAALGPLPRRARLAGPRQRPPRHPRRRHRLPDGPVAAVHRARRRGPHDAPHPGHDPRRRRHPGRPRRPRPPHRHLPLPRRRRRPRHRARRRPRQAGHRGARGGPRRRRPARARPARAHRPPVPRRGRADDHPARRRPAARRRRRRVRRRRRDRHPRGRARGDRRRRPGRARRRRAPPGCGPSAATPGSCPGCCAPTRSTTPPASPSRPATTRPSPGWCWPGWAASRTWATAWSSTAGSSRSSAATATGSPSCGCTARPNRGPRVTELARSPFDTAPGHGVAERQRGGT